MINDGMFTSKTDMWETPRDLFDNLDSEICRNTFVHEDEQNDDRP